MQIGSLKLIEKSEIYNILKTQAFSKSALTDQNTAIEIGKILNANIVVFGNFQKIGNKIKVSARFVDVKTAEIKKDISRVIRAYLYLNDHSDHQKVKDNHKKALKHLEKALETNPYQFSKINVHKVLNGFPPSRE